MGTSPGSIDFMNASPERIFDGSEEMSDEETAVELGGGGGVADEEDDPTVSVAGVLEQLSEGWGAPAAASAVDTASDRENKCTVPLSLEQARYVERALKHRQYTSALSTPEGGRPHN